MSGDGGPLPVREPGTRAPRPRDAATAVVWRRRGGRIEVLMGERHRAHSFMPQRYVFPGGRVDPCDARVRCATELTAAAAARLARGARPGRARSIAAAALRETFEEAGLVVGGPDPAPGRPAPRGWEAFFASGRAPALDRLTYVARAVTPTFRPTRFDARFFLVDAAAAEGELRGSGELENLGWFPIRETGDLELPEITRRVLAHVGERLSGRAPDPRILFFKARPGGGHDRLLE